MKKLILLLCLSSVTAFANEPAFYSVPVAPKLEEYAIFEIDSPEVIQVGEKIQVTYRMPAQLVGANFPPVVLTSPAVRGDSFVLVGENVKAECQVISAQTNCRMEFDGIELDKKEIAKAIKESSKSIKEERLRRKVANVFSGDPVGVLSYSY